MDLLATSNFDVLHTRLLREHLQATRHGMHNIRNSRRVVLRELRRHLRCTNRACGS